MNVLKILGLGLQISIFITVLSLGMRASLGDITRLFRHPRQLIRALISMYVIMPAFAILAVALFELNPVIEIVLLALSVSPIPPLFPKNAIKSGGEASFTFGLLAAVALLSLVMIPLVFVVFGAVFGRQIQFSEGLVIKTLVTALLAPMAIGIALRHFAPVFSERFADPFGKLGVILLIVSVLPILIAIVPTIWSLIGNSTLLALITFALVGAAAGFFLGAPDSRERTVLALATASRHPGIAIALAGANAGEAPKKMIAAAVILYLVISMIVVAPFLKWLSRDKVAGD